MAILPILAAVEQHEAEAEAEQAYRDAAALKRQDMISGLSEAILSTECDVPVAPDDLWTKPNNTAAQTRYIAEAQKAWSACHLVDPRTGEELPSSLLGPDVVSWLGSLKPPELGRLAAHYGLWFDTTAEVGAQYELLPPAPITPVVPDELVPPTTAPVPGGALVSFLDTLKSGITDAVQGWAQDLGLPTVFGPTGPQGPTGPMLPAPYTPPLVPTAPVDQPGVWDNIFGPNAGIDPILGPWKDNISGTIMDALGGASGDWQGPPAPTGGRMQVAPIGQKTINVYTQFFQGPDGKLWKATATKYGWKVRHATRHMNACNPHALRRADRRIQSFAHLVGMGRRAAKCAKKYRFKKRRKSCPR